MRYIEPNQCQICGSTNVEELSIGNSGYIEIRCKDCGRLIFDHSQSSSLDADQDKLAQKWNERA